ncbi:MAG: hypothetical protein KDB18_05745 [Salinibacterium sp.]|nr:hypothetical protein [Salinibacterium sp.]
MPDVDYGPPPARPRDSTPFDGLLFVLLAILAVAVLVAAAIGIFKALMSPWLWIAAVIAWGFFHLNVEV